MTKNGKRTQIWLTLLGLGLFALLLLSKREALADTVDTIQGANLALVMMLPVLQAMNFFVVANYYQSMLALFKEKMPIFHLWGVVAALTFVSQILPSGGMSGLAYLVYGFRNQVSAGVVGLMQLGRYVLSLSSYFLISPIVFIMILISGESQWLRDTMSNAIHSPEAISFIIGFSAIAMVTLVILLARQKTSNAAGKLEKFINRVGSFFRGRRVRIIKKGSIKHAMGDFHDGFDFIKSKSYKILKPFGYIFVNTFFELAIVYIAFEAVGGEISVGILFISFIAAQIAGVVSVIPGDVGVHEGVMIIMLSTLGVDDAIAISATLLYRIFNKMIYLPLGFFFYTKLLNPSKEKAT